MALRTEVQWQAARHELAFAQLFGISQGAPRVIECSLYGAGEVFTLGQTTGQRTGQGATRTVITAWQTLTSVGFAQAITAVQAIVDFGFVAMATGNQQVFDERQEFSAHSSAVPSGSSARMRASGRLGVAMIDKGSRRSRMA